MEENKKPRRRGKKADFETVKFEFGNTKKVARPHPFHTVTEETGLNEELGEELAGKVDGETFLITHIKGDHPVTTYTKSNKARSIRSNIVPLGKDVKVTKDPKAKGTVKVKKNAFIAIIRKIFS